MSNSAIPLKTVAVYEPRLVLNNERTWVVVKGGQTVTYYPFPATSFSNNQFNFICNPPSAQTVLDRAVFIEVPVRLTFTSNGANVVPNNLLQPGRDAFRAFPISSITNTLTATINGFPVNIELSEIIHALSRFHTPLPLKNGWMSAQPAFEDNYQLYSDADGADNNPLGQYGDTAGMAELPRGAYGYVDVSVNNQTDAVIDAVLREQVFLPPFIWDGCQAGGLSNLTSLTFNWILNNNLERIWSHSNIQDIPVVVGPPVVPAKSTIGSINVQFSQPIMYLGFITPRLTQNIPPRITYPYFNIARYTTQAQQTLAPNATMNLKSNIIQLDSIPRKIYLFAKQSNSVIYKDLQAKISTPDVFLAISKLNLTWNNNQGVLSGASPMNLYDLSVQNGYNKSWTEWNGLTQELNGTLLQTTKFIGLEGSIICLELGKDVGLHDNEAEGVLGNWNLQAELTLTNVNQVNTLSPDLYIVCVYDGTLVISNTSAMASIGVVSAREVLDAPVSYDYSMNYQHLEKIYGGSFFSKFKDFAVSANDFLRKYKPISTISGLVPHPYAKGLSAASRALGYGEGEGYEMGNEGEHGGVRAGAARAGEGGILYGGRRMSKKEMLRRVHF